MVCVSSPLAQTSPKKGWYSNYHCSLHSEHCFQQSKTANEHYLKEGKDE